MHFLSEEQFNKSPRKRAEAALTCLEMFNRSDSTDRSDPNDFCHDFYNLAYGFFDIRTLLAASPASIPYEAELRREAILARSVVLRRFPYLLNADLVNRSFASLEALFGLASVNEAVQIGGECWYAKKALAISHYFQNVLHNFYVGHI